MQTKTFIEVKFQFEGFHCWPEAVNHEESYLALKHRHIFHVECMKEVFHDDRDVEFIKFKRDIQAYISSNYVGGALGSKSCEMLAKELLEFFTLNQCKVSEDGENGAIVRRV